MQFIGGFMPSTKKVGAALTEIDAVRAQMRMDAAIVGERELKAIRSMSVACRDCKRTSQLHRWTFIQHRSYTPPSGCTGGDYWSDDSVAFCHIACPSCGKRSYIFTRRDRGILVASIERIIARERIFDAQIVVEADPQRSY
jgi:ribosomal protein S27E